MLNLLSVADEKKSYDTLALTKQSECNEEYVVPDFSFIKQLFFSHVDA